jgi:hypothetical protein
MRLLVTAVAWSGCTATLQDVRVDAPLNAVVHIDSAGVATRVPFQGKFETAGIDVPGIPLTFDLDEANARRIGGDRAVRIYGRLALGAPTELSKTQTLRLAPSENSLRSLLRGEVSEVSAFVTDPNENNVQLARLVLRMAPF